MLLLQVQWRHHSSSYQLPHGCSLNVIKIEQKNGWFTYACVPSGMLCTFSTVDAAYLLVQSRCHSSGLVTAGMPELTFYLPAGWQFFVDLVWCHSSLHWSDASLSIGQHMCTIYYFVSLYLVVQAMQFRAMWFVFLWLTLPWLCLAVAGHLCHVQSLLLWWMQYKSVAAVTALCCSCPNKFDQQSTPVCFYLGIVILLASCCD